MEEALRPAATQAYKDRRAAQLAEVRAARDALVVEQQTRETATRESEVAEPFQQCVQLDQAVAALNTEFDGLNQRRPDLIAERASRGATGSGTGRRRGPRRGSPLARRASECVSCRRDTTRGRRQSACPPPPT